MKPRRRSFSDHKRDQLYRDWLGTDLPVDPERNISNAGDLVGELVDSLGFGQGIDEESLREKWREVAGDFIGQQTHPESLKNGQLKLRVLQPAMRHHLEQSKSLLLSQLQEKLGPDKVKKIDFLLG